MFSWIPIYTETAERLSKLENHQSELIGLLNKMREAGLSSIPLNDFQSEQEPVPRIDIDPFTFLANFNRQMPAQNRLQLWKFLKSKWDLRSDLPTDFHGLTTINPKGAWFLPWRYLRQPHDFSLLWKLAREALSTHGSSPVPESFNECLNIHLLNPAKLTIGLSWLAPRQFLPLSGTVTTRLTAHGISPGVKNAETYEQLLAEVRGKLSSDFIHESHRAWISAQIIPPSAFTFDETTTAKIRDTLFRENEAFATFENPDATFSSNKPDSIHDGLRKFTELGGREKIRQLLAADKPAEALKILTASISLNFVESSAWHTGFGTGNAETSAILSAFLSATEHPWQGAETILPIFDAIALHGLKPAWNTVSVTLWALRPDIYFPIEISHFRKLATTLGTSLPPGRINPFRFQEVYRFAQALALVSETNPRDGTDIHSLLSTICRNFEPESENIPSKANRIWLIACGRGAQFWKDFLEQNIIAIGWDSLGDLSEYESKDELSEILQKEEGATNNPFNNTLACWQFPNEISIGDLVIAKTGAKKILGIGRVTSGYFHDREREAYRNCRSVDWICNGEWDMDFSLHTKTLTDLTPYPGFVRKLLTTIGQERIADDLGIAPPEETERNVDNLPEPKNRSDAPELFDRQTALESLFMSEETFDNILRQLARKKNIILQGPPGVGKTFIARTLAHALIDARDDERIDMVQFHQSYGYEEFVQGLRPGPDGTYRLKEGIFHRFCKKALKDPQIPHVFIIDEINRGNLSRILGELMMLIERDKRKPQYALPLAYSDPAEPRFHIPPNVHIIGLMNTADRSLAMVDYALRRRFAFIDLKPEFDSPKFRKFLSKHGMETALSDSLIAGILELNRTIAADQLDLGDGFRIGHSYLCPDGYRPPDRDWVEEILDFEILPLLQEYWIESPERANREIDKLKSLLP